MLFRSRDPYIKRTLDIYNGILGFVEKAHWSERDIERAVIGCAKAAERPIRPGPATATAAWRYLTGLTEDIRQERRETLLAATPDSVKSAAVKLFRENYPRRNICVVSGRANLEKANTELDDPLCLTPVSQHTAVAPRA